MEGLFVVVAVVLLDDQISSFPSNFASSALMDRLVKSLRVVCEIPTQ